VEHFFFLFDEKNRFYLKWKSFDHILTLAESVNFFKKNGSVYWNVLANVRWCWSILNI